uniref:Putative mitochondrial outer membrane protein n=1 Tax=Panstrongylus lignarius TaxID=156445 RepID=A0A224XEA7_9HEMI
MSQKPTQKKGNKTKGHRVKSNANQKCKFQIPFTLKSEDLGNVTAIMNEKNVDNAVLGQEPWPDDVQLFQPYETEQILLPDMANCLAVQAFLKMCQLKFTVAYRVNAEDMSPSGRVPFIKCGACLVSDLEPITSFVANKGTSLTSHLDPSQKSDMRAYMSLVNNVLGNAENYLIWCDNETYSKITKPRYGSVHPFPLNHILTYNKRKTVIKRLTALGWYEKNLDKVYEEIDRACNALSERLEKADYFFGDKPCELDALIFGHVYSILSTPCFKAGANLAEKLRKFEPIVNHCKRIMPLLNLMDKIELPNYHKSYFNESEELTNSDFDFESEFICSDSESGDVDTPDLQDCGCLFNEKNTIYEAIFSPVLKGNECIFIKE